MSFPATIKKKVSNNLRYLKYFLKFYDKAGANNVYKS